MPQTQPEKSPSPEVLAERERIIALLHGIDKCEVSDEEGWWETSTGAAFGANILAAIRQG